MSSRAGRRALAWVALVGCAHLAHEDPAHGLRFDAPGCLLVVFEVAEADRELVLLERGAARRIEVPAFREARFVDAERLVLTLELPADDASGLPATQLAIHDLSRGTTTRFGPTGRHFDIAPAPDGRSLAVGVEREAVGDADLEIWSLDPTPARVAKRAQALEEPRWHPDGRALAVALVMEDPESDDALGGGFGQHLLSWPRLHRLRSDLGALELVPDAADGSGLVPGGTLPLWWDATGLFARQRRGLVRCDAARGGCALVYAAAPERRIVDGRAIGPDAAWLLSVAALDAFDRREPDEILQIDIANGSERARWHAPPGVTVLDLDWIAARPGVFR